MRYLNLSVERSPLRMYSINCDDVLGEVPVVVAEGDGDSRITVILAGTVLARPLDKGSFEPGGTEPAFLVWKSGCLSEAPCSKSRFWFFCWGVTELTLIFRIEVVRI